MSEEGGFGLNLAEKLFGLVILLIGIFTLYYSLTSTQALMAYTGFFVFLSIVIMIAGIVLLLAKID